MQKTPIKKKKKKKITMQKKTMRTRLEVWVCQGAPNPISAIIPLNKTRVHVSAKVGMPYK